MDINFILSAREHSAHPSILFRAYLNAAHYIALYECRLEKSIFHNGISLIECRMEMDILHEGTKSRRMQTGKGYFPYGN